ncbi:uncharacterized protein FOMMEDRAFT_159434 [Fomitiporia mediterranea MF3/22]|uniref:uncharacterized protein n=1 Tax=Fomitiporia mediterranea (strain MF3/22) TaxID=694068 RepID=UPI00044097AD|nr:uncharacterized protein FOMMEDRAFT_159434 [Fomitiporia mediterranea MF3/22]EJD00668.1 hypothetical protein FOMMEDRAFT_159434 [Fomitiporia mediterranea MF3/22]
MSNLTVADIDPVVARFLLEDGIYFMYFQAATVTLLCYDIITTLDREVKYFWSTPRSHVTWVYFANRYIGVMGGTSLLYWCIFQARNYSCKHQTSEFGVLFLNSESFSGIVTGWLLVAQGLVTRIAIDYILLLRLLALLPSRTRLHDILKISFVAEELFRIAATVYYGHAQGMMSIKVTNSAEMCIVDRLLPLEIFILAWILPLVYELIIMGLTLHRAISFWRLSAGFRGFPLIRVVIIDQVFYFTLIIAYCVFNMLEGTLTTFNAVIQAFVAFGGSESFLCILGSHMLFNMKDAVRHGDNAYDTSTVGGGGVTRTFSNVHFEMKSYPRSTNRYGSDGTNYGYGSKDAHALRERYP